MKLVIVTTVSAFQKDVLKLFKQADIEAFSSSEIDGYKRLHRLWQPRPGSRLKKEDMNRLCSFPLPKLLK